MRCAVARAASRSVEGEDGRSMSATADADKTDRDAELLLQFAAGDQGAARDLTASLLPGALRQAWRMLGDQGEAEDVAQEAMLRLWKQASDWRIGEAKVSTWLYRVVHNLCIDRIRKRRPQVPVEDAPEPVDPDPSVLERMAASEQSKMIAQAIATLPDRQRQALVLRHFEGMSNPQIGEALDCSVEAVESLLARARRQLAKILREEKEMFGYG
ncbi:MAG: RNA polymerase sigma factor [Pseudomonadota bacterium]